MVQPSTFEISSQHFLRILPHPLAAGYSIPSLIQLLSTQGSPVFQLYDHLFGTAYALQRIYIASITPNLELATWPYRHDPDETWSALPHHSALATHYLITHPAWCSFYSPHHPPSLQPAQRPCGIPSLSQTAPPSQSPPSQSQRSTPSPTFNKLCMRST